MSIPIIPDRFTVTSTRGEHVVRTDTLADAERWAKVLGGEILTSAQGYGGGA